MSKKNINYGDDSPIAAFATTPGNSALTLIRCSGKGCHDLFSSVFAPSRTGLTLNEVAANTVIHGWITNANEKVDEVLVSVFRSPKSYTGEDSLDICCHGGFTAGKAVMETLKTCGFRDALPGEFTFRAFINGKIDLTRGESVMELVSAKTDASRRHAVSRLSGSLQKEINEIKLQLVQVLAGAEIYLDYSEDEITADTDEAAGLLPNKEIAHNALERLKKLSASWQIERIFQEGLTVVIAGRPNAGKSSLFNALLKEDRSIVTEIPGTTRDWIEAWCSIDGIPVRLVDTAGLRDSADTVEKIGIERSRQLLQEADIVLYLLDATEGITEEDKEFIDKEFTQRHKDTKNTKEENKFIFVLSKSDIMSDNNFLNDLNNYLNQIPRNPCNGCRRASDPWIKISTVTGEGLEELQNAIAAKVPASRQADSSVSLGTERQKNLVDAAISHLNEALALTDNQEPLDLIAPLLREAVNALGEITGEVSNADIIEEMFSKFCVGK